MVERLALVLLTVLSAARSLPAADDCPPMPKSVPDLIADLAASDAAVRITAADTLAQRGAAARPALPAVRRLLDDANPEVRAAAAEALGKLRLEPDTSLPALVRVLEDETVTARGPLWLVVGFALGEFGEAATPHLIAALRNPRLTTRLAGAAGACRAGPRVKDAVPALIAVLEQNDPASRKHVLNALVVIGPAAKAAIPAVCKMLSSDDFHTQYWACRVLGAIGPEACVATDQLLTLVENGVPSVRRNAAAALGNIGPAVGTKAVAVLIRAVAEPIQPVREEAVIALGKLGPLARPAVPVLEAALQPPRGDFAPRSAAAKALWRLSPQSPLPARVLIEELRSKQEPWMASQILGELGPALGVVGGVIEVLDHPDPEIRLYAVEALGRMGAAAEQALPRLDQLRHDPDEDVRDAAEAALRDIRAVADKTRGPQCGCGP